MGLGEAEAPKTIETFEFGKKVCVSSNFRTKNIMFRISSFSVHLKLAQTVTYAISGSTKTTNPLFLKVYEFLRESVTSKILEIDHD